MIEDFTTFPGWGRGPGWGDLGARWLPVLSQVVLPAEVTLVLKHALFMLSFP